MSKLWLIGLAASAAWTPAAIAQGVQPAPVAHGSHAPAPMVGHGGGHHVIPPAMHGGGMKGMKGGGHIKGMKGMPGGHFKGMKGWQRFGRGHVIPPHFRHKQFFVHDWRAFGWPAPMPGGNWIRYYDDALLIDGHGRVVDGRYGWDWDRRGDHMAYGDGGYEGGHDRDDYYDRDDYGHGEDHGEDGYGRGHHEEGDRVVRVYRHGDGHEGSRGGCSRGCAPGAPFPPPPPHPGYGHGPGGGYGYGSGYGYGMGYGYGYGGGAVVVTETITTTAPVMETHTYYETVTERRAAPRRHYRKPVVRRSVKPAYRAPAPRPGERG